MKCLHEDSSPAVDLMRSMTEEQAKTGREEVTRFANERLDEMRDEIYQRKIMTSAAREANKVFKTPEAKRAITEDEKVRKAFQNSRERLKAERLARDKDSARSITRRLYHSPRRWFVTHRYMPSTFSVCMVSKAVHFLTSSRKRTFR